MQSAPDTDQAAAIEKLQGGRNVFLTGMAGTGKTTTLLSWIAQAFHAVEVTATTGIAALNMQQHFLERANIHLPAYTVYRWAGIGLGPAEGQDNESYYRYLIERPQRMRYASESRIIKAECLVIDEISMLPGRVFNFLDFYFRKVRRKDFPFGGIKIVVVGDFLQLPPVAKSGRYDWSFASKAWKESSFAPIHLTRIHRQDAPAFVAALNSFRLGYVSRDVADTLSARVKMFVDRKVVRLMTHNAQVNKWNAYQLGELDGAEKVYSAEFSGPDHEVEFLKKNSITPCELVLKVGARVMVTANITIEGSTIAVNGQCGEVAEMGAESVLVRLDNGQSETIPLHIWQFNPQDDRSATMQQIPLRPAYALTIHKSQGLTLDRAHIDIRAAREPGQAYVALSRLRSIEGLYLKEWIKGVHVSDAAINFYKGIKK